MQPFPNSVSRLAIRELIRIVVQVEDILGVLSLDSPGECPILTLDVDEIFFDLLGLQIQTSEIEIDITAVAGEGNLLGNLLCAVAGLLDP